MFDKNCDALIEFLRIKLNRVLSNYYSLYDSNYVHYLELNLIFEFVSSNLGNSKLLFYWNKC